MASYVYFKFKSQKEPQRVTIDGPHTDVWNLKREIISISRLGDGTDFDLKIYKENTNEEYTDDTEIIPKDSTVLARRLPASAPGKGRAARYVSGKPPVSAKPSTAAAKPTRTVDMSKAMTEEERLNAMLNFTDASWQQKQEEMSLETRVPIQGARLKNRANVPEGEPPHGYICYRCGKKGHFIQACPTNDDASYDNRSRIKRTTGIPRSMLKKIDEADLAKLDDDARQNVMVNAEGEYVFAQADEKAWKKHLEQVKADEAAQRRAKVGNKELQDRGLECSIDKRLFVDPMKTPCCGRTYCHDCIENALLENDLTCPGCETENVSLEGLLPDEDVKAKIKAYQDEKSNEKQRSRSPTASAANTPTGAEPDEQGSRPVSRDGSKSPKSDGGQSRKRTADEANGRRTSSLEVPAMKRQKSADGSAVSTPKADDEKPATPADLSNANNMDNMPFNMMPPDMSQMNMNNMGMNFPMNPMMPFMGMPNMNMNMNMNMMNPMMMPNMMMGVGMNGMPSMPAGPNNNQFSNQNHHGGNWQHGNNVRGSIRGSRGGGGKHFQPQQPVSEHRQPEGMTGVPTGPKALQSPAPGSGGGGAGQQQQGAAGGFYPPTGPSAGKFANQQRYAGKDEDNAYMRQPVNPQRQWQRSKRGRMREADYREL